MSIILPVQDLTAAVVGTTGTVDLSAANAQTAYGENPAHARLYNESGCGLVATIGQRGGDLIPAGGWMEFEVRATDGSINYVVDYVLPNAPVSRLRSTFYRPDETIPPLFLGNSPIGVSGVPLAVTQVIQDAQPNAQTILESTPTGQPQNLLMTTDGNFTMAGNLKINGMQIDYNGSGSTTEFFTPRSGSANGQLFYAWSGSANAAIMGIAIQNGAPFFVTRTGGLGVIGNQSSVGSFGVPVIVAQAIRTAVAVTTLTTILSFAPPANGLYRISGYMECGGTGTPNLSMAITWHDAGGGQGANMSIGFATGTPGSPLTLNGTTALGAAPFSESLIPVTFYAVTGTNIVCNYLNSGGVPNDHATYLIERLA